MSKIIFGFVGQAGSGKGTAANILHKKYGAEVFTFSDILHHILNRLFLPNSRDNLIKMSQTLRESFGQDILANTMERQVAESNCELIVVDGIRRIQDIEDLRKNPNFHLIEIQTLPATRFERLKLRNEKPGESSMSWEEFLEMGNKETEVTIAAVAQQAELRIDNQGSMEELDVELERVISELKS